jgi:hypothetical protein
MKPLRTKRTNRAGYVYVLFAMLFLCLFGLAGLVIDLGFARLAQQEMQTAVDSAALEGLRWRDVQQWQDLPQAWLADPEFQGQVGPPGTGPISPRQRETIRRWAASRMVANVFDDDLDPNDGDPMNYGAGPVVQFQGGIPTLPSASQLIVVPPLPVYKPHTSSDAAGLELNAPNAPNGDMAAGVYGLDPSYPQAFPPDEDEGYARRDFRPAPPPPTSAPAFLVRMRRTRLWDELDGLDDAPGVSSAGPPLPYLFARGTPLHPATVERGVAVRATAIAAAQDGISLEDGKTHYSAGRAKAAGPPHQYATNIPGVAPFALVSWLWGQDWTTQQLTIAADGTTLVAGDGRPWGKVLQPATNVVGIGQQVGGPNVPAGNAGTLASIAGSSLYSPENLYRYVPVYNPGGAVAPGSIIVGFGYVEWTWNASSGTLTLTKGAFGPQPFGDGNPPDGPYPPRPRPGSPAAQPVGYGNVTGAFVRGLPLDSSDFDALFKANATFGSPLYAPVLVDHYIGPNP